MFPLEYSQQELLHGTLLKEEAIRLVINVLLFIAI